MLLVALDTDAGADRSKPAPKPTEPKVGNPSDPRASENGRFKNLVRVQECKNRGAWPSSSGNPYTYESKNGRGSYYCASTAPVNTYTVFWNGHFYHWSDRIGPSRPLGNKNAGESIEYGEGCHLCEPESRQCHMACSRILNQTESEGCRGGCRRQFERCRDRGRCDAYERQNKRR